MAFGGGTWTAQDKRLPGTYINFVSASGNAEATGERGVVACPIMMDWGPAGEVFDVTAGNLAKQSHKLFGYTIDTDEMTDVYEVFCYATHVYFYRLNGGGTKAANTYAEAKYNGTYGNKITIKIAASTEVEGGYIVSTIVDGEVEDAQTVTASTDLKANDWVTWKTFELAATAGTPLTGGANAATVTAENHTAAMRAFEPYQFDVMIAPADDAATINVYIAYAKRMNYEMGIKFQLVTFKTESTADCELASQVENTVEDDQRQHALVYWIGGAIAGCALNTSLTGTVYNGRHKINTNYSQTELADLADAGRFVMHRTGDVVRVLRDINSLVTFTDEKSETFSRNQTMRVVNYLATADAALFNENYSGVYINNDAARSKLRNDLTEIRAGLVVEGAIGPYAGNMVISAGEDGRSVVMTDEIEIAETMEKLYITQTIA